MKNFLGKFSISLILLLCLSTSYVYAFNEESKADNNPKENKIIYLTFDDGPRVNTNKVLDTLNEYNVKATFFLIGNQIKGQEDVVKRIQDEGHSIGLHTYTHDFKKIYSNNQAFIDEMLKCQEEIYRVTGTRPNIIRFPGGSVKRLNKGFKKELEEKDFKVYDWNVDSQDGIKPKMSPNKIFKKATESNVKDEPTILLMHCDYMQKNTCKALPEIIKFYKDKGYEFKTINNGTPECYFPLRK
ncbi:polysaccharide deacetylase [Clostridium sporogenes]|nr:polysaccharide deacetylase [Clostridium sporogenes]MBZ1328236.1 polysaccharide deacetylase [Clostridium botulinum]KRU31891.1 polysaccharide deacetylase [Clostridium sporogenes]KRU34159.1 polysaccharide deacetylase [Clostridium sporogenes]KRU41176.1 polysaccharide deacetylase [Clostridium sporogenes]